MKLTSLFEKQVDRKIEGVIKADDQASLLQEVEEYVLTLEVSKRLEAFLDAYNNYEGANGVWISGFFGSGKSHLLKMLALLLEDRQVEGQSVIDLFDEKPEVRDNEILRGDLKRAATIPSKSVLFNIDQKADVISKTQIDALLAVFVKVFDESCGYYGKQGHIARFERDLDSRDVFDAFQAAFKTAAGIPWTTGREQALLEGGNIAKAYAAATGKSSAEAEGILDKYRSEYRVSIEDFAEQVQAYIQQQPDNFRLNFFVDEVGQYIADNVKLMTNLQTIAESLATKCRGQAWVIVTAQEEMDSVLGEMGQQSSADFSKIQDRFSNRLKLTGADVAEVIQRRLLHKNDQGVEELSTLYHQQSNNFKTLLDFADGAASYRNFRDRDHFIHSYPFIPYQFPLFQSAIQSLSQHSAFEGRHTSVGQRSMLGVFQQVAVHIGDHEVGQIATFDLMFEGIRNSLKSQIQRAVLQAEGQLEDAFAIRVLKALFLVKYVKEFNATVRNVCVLMLERFDQDIGALRRKVEEALQLLEQQTYIQRNGENYEYLTDEEKDVEEEIKNTDVETTDVSDELDKLVFDHVLGQRKIRLEAKGQDYAYSRKLDDRLQGREHELAIHVVSPFHENSGNVKILQMQNTGRDELMLVLPEDERLMRDLLMYKRTEKYIRQNISVTQQDTIKRILTERGLQNQERHTDIRNRVKDLLGKARVIVAGTELDVGSSDPQTRMLQGFQELVVRVYPNLRMLRGHAYSEEDVGRILNQSKESLFGEDAAGMEEAEQEMLAFIQSNHRGGVRSTVKSVVERFEKKPYGWAYPAVLCILAKLCARGKVEVRSDGNLLDDEDLESALRNTHGQGNVVLDPQVEFTASQVRALKEFYDEFFSEPPATSDAKALGKETGLAFAALVSELKPLLAQQKQYPFLNALTPVLADMEEVCGKPYTWYLTELRSREERLLDAREKVIEPIQRFWGGPQKQIYDNARDFAREQEANLQYLEQEEDSPSGVEETIGKPAPSFDSLRLALADPECYRGPRMKEVKTLLDSLDEQISKRLGEEIRKAVASVEAMEARLKGMDEFQALNPGQKDELSRPFAELKADLDKQVLIAMVRDRLHSFEEREYQSLLARMATWANPPPKPAGQEGKEDGESTKSTAVDYVSLKSLKVDYPKAWVTSEAEVEAYLSEVKRAMMAEIKKGKRVQL